MNILATKYGDNYQR